MPRHPGSSPLFTMQKRLREPTKTLEISSQFQLSRSLRGTIFLKFNILTRRRGMRVLITGSEGVLGSTLKRELRSRGHEVFGCDMAHSADAQVLRADVSERRQLERVYDFAK